MSELPRKRISRRRFVKYASAGVLAGGLSHLVGCGPQPTAAPELATSAPAATAVPTLAKVLKTVRFANSQAQGPAATADPAKGTSNMDALRGTQCYDQLVWLDNNLEPQPMLAKSWEFNDDASEWIFHLRDDVKFHNGKKFTAADVVYTFKRIFDPATASAGAGAMVGLDPDGIEALDDYRVRFKLPSAIVDLFYLINTRQAFIVPEGVSDDDLRFKGIGTGPFKIEHFVPGEDPMIFVKNEDYWRTGYPKIDVLELRSFTETASRFAALERGQVDVIQDPPKERLAEIEANPELQVLSQRAGSWSGMYMKLTEPPFDNQDLVLALKYCVDRQAMLDVILQGYGQIGSDVAVAPWIKYGLPDPPRERNIDKAKEHLVKAGYPDGIDLEFTFCELEAQWPAMAAMFKENCADVGINLELSRVAADTFWSESWMQEPFCMTTWSMRTCDASLAVMYTSEAEWNESDWKSPAFDELLFKARQTLDLEERTKLYQDAQRLAQDEAGTIVPIFNDNMVGARAGITWQPPARTNFWNFREIEIED